MDELRAPIEEDLGLNKKVDLARIHGSIEHLKDRARLGHLKSIETLIDLGNDIAYFLSDIVQPADQNERPNAPESSPLCEEPERGWRETLDECVLILLKLLEAEENQGKDRFDDLLEDLPANPHVFPIRSLEGTTQYSDTWGEVTYLCDSLVQQRLDREAAKGVLELAARSLCWPLFVTVEDYQSKKPLAACMQNLELGRAIASNLGVTPRGEDSPAALVRPLLIGLEQLRRISRTPQQIEDMRRSEEMNEPASLNKLIADARKRLTKADKVKLNWEKLRKEQRLNDRSYLTKLVDEALEELRRADQMELRWERLRQSEEWNELDVMNLLIKVACIDLTARYGFWCLQNLWRRKAALLPPFQRNPEVINQWVEAAYAYLASVYDGDFEKVKWSHSIDKAIEKAGSVDAGLKQFLREGFKTLSGADRKC